MINYIWAALLIVAVAYAGVLDILKKKPVEKFDAVVMIDEASGPMAVSYDISQSDDRPTTIGLIVAQKYPISSSWGKENTNAKSLELTIEGDDSGNLLVFAFVDSEGYRFIGGNGVRLGPATDPREVTVDLGALVPAPENPGVKPTWPLDLSLDVRATLTATAATGMVSISEATVNLSDIVHRSGSYKDDKRWLGVLTESAAGRAKEAIELALGLVGLMALWLGLMKIAEAAGLVRLLARAMKPIMTRLFPDLHPEGDAMGAILMNVAANMMGLGNAATPLGIKAMQEIQKENPAPEYASNAQCMLLAINTSSVTLIPATIISIRASVGSADLMKFWPVMVATTLISTITAVIVCKVLEKLPTFQIPAAAYARKSLDRKLEEE